MDYLRLPPQSMRLMEALIYTPVWINCDQKSFGTGFFINYGTNTYLITVHHVLFDGDRLWSEELLIRAPAYGLSRPMFYNVNIAAIEGQGKILKSPKDDICSFIFCTHDEIPGSNSVIYSPIENVIPTLGFIGSIVSLRGEIGIGKMKDVRITNEIFVAGYPSLNGDGSEFIDQTKPLFRTGMASGVNIEKNKIILDCNVYYGNSGGPVIQIDNQYESSGIIIGVLLKQISSKETWKNHRTKSVYFDEPNTGYAVATSMDAVIKMLEV